MLKCGDDGDADDEDGDDGDMDNGSIHIVTLWRIYPSIIRARGLFSHAYVSAVTTLKIRPWQTNSAVGNVSVT